MENYHHLSYEERIILNVKWREGLSIREIAKGLCRAPSTISRELRRNEQFAETRLCYPYDAQMKANGRRRRAYRKPRLKHKRIQRYVERKLKLGWSPEQIAGALKVSKSAITVSHEAIYQYIYSKRPDLRQYLCRHHSRRKRKKQSKKHSRLHILNRVPVKLRSKEANQRTQIGHWESDLMVSNRTPPAVIVCVDRKNRLSKIIKIPNHQAITVSQALVRRLKALPPKACRSITYDNGSENSEHMRTNKILGTKSFFCEPYHSW